MAGAPPAPPLGFGLNRTVASSLPPAACRLRLRATAGRPYYNTAMARDPYELICNPDKTTLTVPGGVVLGYGPGPGLRHAIFWNRVGSLFSCYRPAVALLTLFRARDPHHPVALTTKSTGWEPNLARAGYAAPGLKLEERRTALKAGLRCLLKLTNTTRKPQEWLLAFHGAVEQWEFFDYQRGTPEPLVECAVQPTLRRLTLTQPHPHDGLPPVNSLQTVTLSHPLAAYGFAQSESELATLWHDHGCLAHLRLRLGQVGGRFIPPPPPVGRTAVSAICSASPTQGSTPPESRTGPSAPPAEPAAATFRHHHPVYYLTVRVVIQPGQTELVSIATQFQTDDPGGKIEGAYDGTARDEWEQYLREEVPQLECSDKELERYWYYVWYVLRANRTAPGAHVKHPFTAPSKYMYWGPWIWDGYFHVLGEMWLKDREVAKDSIRAVLDMQFPNGFIPVCSGSQYRMCFHDEVPGYKPSDGKPGGYASYVPPEIAKYQEGAHPFEAHLTVGAKPCFAQPDDTTRKGRSMASPLRLLLNEKTQTPLITVAAYEYFRLHDDRDFAREVLPKLWAYEEWLWRRRTDSKGRFILWHGDESGWDNATRHYPVPAKPFDVQVHTLMHRQGLLILQRQLLDSQGLDPTQTKVLQRSLATLESRFEQTHRALKTYWEENDQWHYDFGAAGNGQRSGPRRKQIAAAGLFALLPEPAERTIEACHNALAHPRVFGTAYPIPTLAACDPDHAPHGWGWNGPVWLQVNYFVITGLMGAGKYSEAFKLWDQTRALIIRDGQPHSFELYDAELGTGMGCPDYSWQAMINHLVIRYFAGVGYNSLHPALPPGMDQLQLTNLPGLIQWVTLARRGKQLEIQAGLQRPERLNLATTGLGDVKTAVANGHQLVTHQHGHWTHPAASEPAREWEIIVTCRK